VALIFFLLGAPFVAALEVIIYAGAIMVLFVFVVMMLNLGPTTIEQERRWMTPGMWVGPSLLSLILLGELAYLLFSQQTVPPHPGAMPAVGPTQVGTTLFGPYVIGVELASVLLLPGLIGAYHLGRRSRHEDR
jgi:NADH-quinone oxidoreductase subunit J